MPAALPAKPMICHFGDGQRAAAPGPFSLESAGHEPGRIEGLNRFVFLVSLAIDSTGRAFRCIVRRYIEGFHPRAHLPAIPPSHVASCR